MESERRVGLADVISAEVRDPGGFLAILNRAFTLALGKAITIARKPTRQTFMPNLAGYFDATGPAARDRRRHRPHQTRSARDSDDRRGRLHDEDQDSR